jgi:hypothetical protein
MEEFTNGLGDAWANVATFVPKFLGFLLILGLGYVVAKGIAKLLEGVLERVGFDRVVERGGVRQALARSKYDASDILAKIAFWVLFLFVLQLAFGIFGTNPISELITGVVSYLPKLFAAILIVVVGAAIAAAVKEIVEAAIGGLSYGRSLAIGASVAILTITAFAALSQLEIAPAIVNGLFYGLLAIIVGSSIVAIGGGGIRTMQQYWDRASQRLENETQRIQNESQGASDRIAQRAETRKEQVKQAAGVGGRSTSSTPTSSTGEGNVGEALHRDWEQTKADMPGDSGTELGQDAGDTLRQATGKQPPNTTR